MKITIKVKEALENRGMTQKQLAELTGIRPNAISMLARGFIDRINKEHIEKIASALNIKDINELITLEDESAE